MRDLLLFVGGEAPAATRYAVSLAARLSAHLTVAAIAERPRIPGYVSGLIPPETFESMAARQREAAEAPARVALEAARIGGATAEKVIVEADEAAAIEDIAALARHFDMTVMQQPGDRESGFSRVAEALLFDSGRPLLLVPYIQEGPAAFDRALVAWDGSRQAARAVADGLPLLKRAATVDVVTVNDRRGAADLPGFNITRHIARHGIDVSLQRITSGVDIGNTLLSHAADIGADLLVMGGYGHSRLRQFVIGGTTRTVMESMTLPVLFAH